MPALDQEALNSVCRSLYRQASSNYILPPLLRDASDIEGYPGYTYRCSIDEREVHFTVALQQASVDDAEVPFSHLPLRFHVAMFDISGSAPAIELTLSDKQEMIRAFLLGVKAPIVASDGQDETKYEISVQVSSTYFVRCGDLIDKDKNIASKDIYESVGFGLYNKSKDFFGALEDGVAVWSARVAQDLFGEPKPAAELLWPRGSGPPAATTPETVTPVPVARPEPVAAPAPAEQKRPRFAMAAAILLAIAGCGGLVETMGLRSAASRPTETPSRRDEIGYAIDKAVTTARGAVERPAAPRAPESRTIDARPLGEIRLATLAPIALPAPVDLWRGAYAARDAAPVAETSATIAPSASVQSGVAAALAGRARLAAASRPKAAPATARPSHRPTRAGSKRQFASPLALMRRAVASLTGVVKKLKPAHYRFSALNSPRAAGP